MRIVKYLIYEYIRNFYTCLIAVPLQITDTLISNRIANFIIAPMAYNWF